MLLPRLPVIRLLFCILTIPAVAHAENTPGGPDPASIEHKAGIKADQELYLRFKAEGNRLLDPHSYKGKDADKEMVKFELMNGGPGPGRVLVVHNHFGRTLCFRAIVRLQDKPEYAKVTNNVIKVAPGATWCHFWPAANPIEEAVLYQFSLSNEPLNKDE